MTLIADKAAHVRAAGQTRNHGCHWPGCQRQVPPAKWGCLQHWRRLPLRIQRRIWDSYRIGQEADGRPSREYIEAAKEAQDWIRAQGLALPHQVKLL